MNAHKKLAAVEYRDSLLLITLTLCVPLALPTQADADDAKSEFLKAYVDRQASDFFFGKRFTYEHNLVSSSSSAPESNLITVDSSGRRVLEILRPQKNSSVAPFRLRQTNPYRWDVSPGHVSGGLIEDYWTVSDGKETRTFNRRSLDDCNRHFSHDGYRTAGMHPEFLSYDAFCLIVFFGVNATELSGGPRVVFPPSDADSKASTVRRFTIPHLGEVFGLTVGSDNEGIHYAGPHQWPLFLGDGKNLVQVDTLATFAGQQYPASGTYKDQLGYEGSFRLLNVESISESTTSDWLLQWPSGTDVSDSISGTRKSTPYTANEYVILQQRAAECDGTSTAPTQPKRKLFLFINLVLAVGLIVFAAVRFLRKNKVAARNDSVDPDSL